MLERLLFMSLLFSQLCSVRLSLVKARSRATSSYFVPIDESEYAWAVEAPRFFSRCPCSFFTRTTEVLPNPHYQAENWLWRGQDVKRDASVRTTFPFVTAWRG